MPDIRELAKKLAYVLFGAWLFAFMLLLLVTALYDRKRLDLITIGCLVAYGGLFLLFWRQRARIVERLPFEGATLGRFILVGWLAAMLVEVLLYFTLSYAQGISLVLDLAYTTPTYVGLLLGWWIYLRRYPLSYRETFFLAGFIGVLIEMPQKLLSGQSPLSMLAGLPLHVAIYGSIVLVPVAVFDLGTYSPRAPLFRKYLFGLVIVPLIVLPALALSVVVLFVGKRQGL